MQSSAQLDDMFDEEPEPEPKQEEKKVSIQDLLSVEQEIIVQVSKEPINTKGARVTTNVSIPGKYFVYMPFDKHVAISRKINSYKEKQRLRKIIHSLRPKEGGLIVRTAAANKPKEYFEKDLKNFERKWKLIKKTAQHAKAPYCLYQEVDVTLGLLRDIFTPDVDRIVIDSKAAYRNICDYVETFAPQLSEKVEFYEEDSPIFDAFGIEKEIDKIYHAQVPLPSGGYLVIEHTEALTSIDVNTGRFIGKKSFEETIFRTNQEAAREVARQIRLRDIGGIIVIDFIDMEVEKHRQTVISTLREDLRKDRAKSKALQVSELGLVEMSRKRVRPSLIQSSTEICPHCHGAGRLPSPEMVCSHIERWLTRAALYLPQKQLLLKTHPKVFDYLQSSHRLEQFTGFEITIEEETSLLVHQFKFFSLVSGKELTKKFSS